MGASSRRFVVVATVLAFAWGGVQHHEALTALSQGSFFFPPEHPAHAPFVPEPEHLCLACALSVLSVPAAVPVFLLPPPGRLVVEVRVETRTPAPDPPELPGRSPPLSPA